MGWIVSCRGLLRRTVLLLYQMGALPRLYIKTLYCHKSLWYVSIRITVFVLPRVSVWLHSLPVDCSRRYSCISVHRYFLILDIVTVCYRPKLLMHHVIGQCIRCSSIDCLSSCYMFCIDVCIEHYTWPICNRLIYCNCVSCVSCMKRLYPIVWFAS